MSDRNSMDDWQLQESPDSGDQWQLLDQEQNLSANLQLQEAPAGAEQWRPVAYEETPYPQDRMDSALDDYFGTPRGPWLYRLACHKWLRDWRSCQPSARH